MTVDQLVEGLVLLLRDEIDDWAEYNGHPNVQPMFPANLRESDYPMATVEIEASDTTAVSLDMDVFVWDALTNVTVWGVDAGTVDRLVGEVEQAIVDNHDKEEGGDPVLNGWVLQTTESVTPRSENTETSSLPRYGRGQDFVFETVTKAENE